MQFSFSSYTLPLFAAALLSIFIAIFAYIHRSARGARELSFLASMLTLWTIGYVLEISGTDLATKYQSGVFQYIAIPLSPYAWMMFCIVYNAQTKLNSRRFLLLAAIIPVITILVAQTNKWHGLLWNEYRIDRVGDFSALGVSHGPWFSVHLIYSYLNLLVGAVLIVMAVWRKQGLYQGQVVALLAAVLAPWIGNILYLTGNSPIPYLDLTPLAFTVTTAALAWAIFGFRLVDIAPIARDLIVEGLREGLIVVDLRGRIVDINTAAVRMVGLPARQCIGKPVREVLQPWLPLLERFRDALDANDVIEIGKGEASRKLGVRISALYDKRQNLVGRIINFWELDTTLQVSQSVFPIERTPQQLPAEEVFLPTELPKVPSTLDTLKAFFVPSPIEIYSSLHPSPRWAQTIERTFTIIMRIVSVLGVTALVLSLSFFREVTVFLIDSCVVIAILWFLGLARRIPFDWRMLIFFTALYILTVRELASYGYSPEGFAFCLTFVTLAVLLAGLRGGLIAFGAIFATLATLGALIGGGWYHPPLTSPDSVIPESLSLVMPRLTVFLVLTGALGAAIYALLHSLSHSQQRETQTLNLLQQERDLLEQRVVERTNDLAKARDQALQASNFKSQLLSRVSHELRTPLNGVLGFAELLKMNAYGALNERQIKATVNIIDSAHYLTHMVNDLLDEAQIETGTIVFNIVPFSPAELLKDVSITLSVLASKKGLTYLSECSPDLPDQLHGDVNRLHQLIINLAGNAIKFTQTGEVRVRFLHSSPGQWTIQISDTGVGISKDAQKYIFDAFRQVDNNITRENRGSGLGLSITKQLVELMGGQISLESEMEKGSTFTVILPIILNSK